MSRFLLLFIPALFACSAIHWPYIRDAERMLETERMGPDEVFKITPLHEDWRQTVSLVQMRGHVRLHYHKEHTEYVYVLEGEGILTIGLEQKQIQPRDWYKIPPNSRHSYINTGSEPTVVVSIFEPKYDGEDRHAVFEPDPDAHEGYPDGAKE